MRNLVVVSVCLLAGTAQAKWGNENSSSGHVFRQEVTVREANDGRAGMRESVGDSRSLQREAPASNDQFGRQAHAAPLPLTTQVTLKMQGGDNRDSDAAKSNPAAQPSQNASNDLFGRQAKPAPLPLNAHTQMRIQLSGGSLRASDSEGSANQLGSRVSHAGVNFLGAKSHVGDATSKSVGYDYFGRSPKPAPLPLTAHAMMQIMMSGGGGDGN